MVIGVGIAIGSKTNNTFSGVLTIGNAAFVGALVRLVAALAFVPVVVTVGNPFVAIVMLMKLGNLFTLFKKSVTVGAVSVARVA